MNKHKSMRMHLSPFSIIPFQDIKIFKKQLPYSTGQSHILGIYFSLAALTASLIGVFVISWSIFSKLDPWAKIIWGNGTPDTYWISVLLLLFFTGRIGWKQWCYYYKEGGIGKEGIFIKSIRQVNNREAVMDIFLAICGGMLFFFCFFPICWFMALTIYSLLVVLRSYFTLQRKYYQKKLEELKHEGKLEENIKTKTWYEELNKEHNGLIVKFVLRGWVGTHSIIALYSLIVFLIFIYHFEWMTFELLSIPVRFFFLVGVLIVLLILYFKLSNLSYSWFKTICDY